MSNAHTIADQIIYGKLASVSRYAGEQLRRVSRSSLLAENGAFAAGVITGEGALANQFQAEAEHLYALRSAARELREHFEYDLEEGDVLITADVYVGGTKAQMLTMMLPVFAEGELVLSPVIRAQMADLGGEYPGGYNPDAFEVWQESMRLTPVKLYKGGKLQRDVWRFLLANSRAGKLLESDIQAMYACLMEARKSILKLLGIYGISSVNHAVERMKHHTRQRTLELLTDIPEEISGESPLFLQETQEKVLVKVRRSPEHCVFDFSGTSGQLALPYNITAGTTAACAVTALMAEHLDLLPINDGLLDVFEFNLPSNSVVNPGFPAATALGLHSTGHAVARAITTAIQRESNPDFAGVHGPAPLTVLYPPVGSQAVMEPVFLEPGFTISQAGWGAPVLQGGRKLVSAEELEWRSDLRIRHRKLSDDGGMEVQLEVLHGRYEACIFVPGGETEFRIVNVANGARNGTGTGVPVAKGDILDYRYGCTHETSRTEKEDDIHETSC
ncbi:Acetophenone carboxylase delta subunit [compost metagenome]